MLPKIALTAARKTVGGELSFTFPEVLEIIMLCTINEIAVLGVEIFEVHSHGYRTKTLSIYDQQMKNSPNQKYE
ncbi:MAG TPA: hypothetical protein VKZ53_19190 [Candidatus Angelobacter sp.]|nr:hypothetical protein [Candidatus Angelobacter sp.]